MIVRSVAISPDGKHVAGAGGNPYRQQNGPYPACVAVWETDTGRLVRVRWNNLLLLMQNSHES